MSNSSKWQLGKKRIHQISNSGAIKDVIKIRLYTWEFRANYGKKGLDNRCPMCQSEEDTKAYFLECNKGDMKFNLKDERGKKWREIVEIFRKKTRKIDQ